MQNKKQKQNKNKKAKTNKQTNKQTKTKNKEQKNKKQNKTNKQTKKRTCFQLRVNELFEPIIWPKRLRVLALFRSILLKKPIFD